MAILQARRVTKMFGGLAAVSLVDFDLREGEILGLIGPNGSGKTTLVNVITGVLPYSDGDVLFRGQSIRGLRPHEIGRLGLSRTFQVVKPFRNLSVLQNVMVGALFGARGGARELAKARSQAEEAGIRRAGPAGAGAQEVLEFVGLAHRAQAPAEGLNVPERKRMELARALAMRPTILFLDEVMAGLNPAEIDEAVGLIKRIRDRGITLVVIEHVMKAIRNVSDRIMVFTTGRNSPRDRPKRSSTTPRSSRPTWAGATRSRPMLEIRGLNAGYGEVQILRDVSFSVGKGEIVTLVGSNGAGKSTLLNTVCGIMRPRSGSVHLDGRGYHRVELGGHRGPRHHPGP